MKPFLILLLSIGGLISCSKKYTQINLADDYNQLLSTNRGVQIIDRYDDLDGFYVFYRDNAKSEHPRQLIYFMHGLGALNPAIYGKWIRHLIDQSAVVVYPRYQMATMKPLPNKFSEIMPQAFHRSYNYIQDSLELNINYADFHFIGHSYGGAAINYLCANLSLYNIPKPKSIMACHPGTGPFSALVLDEYADIPAETKLVVISAENDVVVGDKMSEIVFNTAIQTKKRVWIRHYQDGKGDYKLKADHRSPYAIDTLFDNRIMNGTARRAWSHSQFDAEDFAGFFKIGDELRNNKSAKSWLFDRSKLIWPLGLRKDGTELRPFELIHPKEVRSE